MISIKIVSSFLLRFDPERSTRISFDLKIFLDLLYQKKVKISIVNYSKLTNQNKYYGIDYRKKN